MRPYYCNCKLLYKQSRYISAITVDIICADILLRFTSQSHLMLCILLQFASWTAFWCISRIGIMQFCFLHHFMAEGSAKMKRQRGIKLHDVRVQRRAASPHNATSTATAQYYLEQKCNTTYNNSATVSSIKLNWLNCTKPGQCGAASTCHQAATFVFLPLTNPRSALLM